jgi:hypothetical protein
VGEDLFHLQAELSNDRAKEREHSPSMEQRIDESPEVDDVTDKA